MALQIAYTDSGTGASFPQAYARVSVFHLEHGLGSSLVQLSVALYRDAQARQSGLNPLGTVVYTLTSTPGDPTAPAFQQFFAGAVIATSSIVSQSYAYLKTLPLFQGAQNV